jgi:hypothetical protein
MRLGGRLPQHHVDLIEHGLVVSPATAPQAIKEVEGANQGHRMFR